MKLTLLGTGNAVVTACYNTCFILTDESRPQTDRHFLVDGGGGSGILTQLKRADIPWRNIRTVFVTHCHLDHITGIFWIIRMITSAMKAGNYAGTAQIYGHEKVIRTLRETARLVLSPQSFSFLDDRLRLAAVEDGESCEILGRRVSFFDIRSEKEKQFGFAMELAAADPAAGRSVSRLVCCGDEPCSEAARPLVKNADWLLHEAFCLYEDAGRFKPYEKSHSTVKDACELAQSLHVRNLVLYHTEETDLAHRRARYTAEGRQYFSGNLLVPDDLEVIDLDKENR